MWLILVFAKLINGAEKILGLQQDLSNPAEIFDEFDLAGITDEIEPVEASVGSALVANFFEFWKLLLLIVVVVVVAVCLCGGGGLFWYAKKNDLKASELIDEVGEVVEKTKDLKADFSQGRSKAREKRREEKNAGEINPLFFSSQRIRLKLRYALIGTGGPLVTSCGGACPNNVKII